MVTVTSPESACKYSSPFHPIKKQFENTKDEKYFSAGQWNKILFCNFYKQWAGCDKKVCPGPLDGQVLDGGQPLYWPTGATHGHNHRMMATPDHNIIPKRVAISSEAGLIKSIMAVIFDQKVSGSYLWENQKLREWLLLVMVVHHEIPSLHHWSVVCLSQHLRLDNDSIIVPPASYASFSWLGWCL